MAQPSREEILAEIDRLAAAKGINREVFRQTVEKESSLNPAAVGDSGQSFGLAQLYMGGGLGNTYEQQYGKPPSDPEDWRKHLAFMADQIVSGGKGLEPWHAWKGAPDAWQTGNQASAAAAPVSRGRAGQVMPPAQVTPGQQPAQDDGLLAAFRDWQNPKKTTLGGWALAKAGLIDPKDPNKPETLGELAFQSLGFGKDEKTAAADKAVKGTNPLSPTSIEDQMAAKAKNRNTVGSTLFSAITGRPPVPAVPQKKTLGTSFLSLFS